MIRAPPCLLGRGYRIKGNYWNLQSSQLRNKFYKHPGRKNTDYGTKVTVVLSDPAILIPERQRSKVYSVWSGGKVMNFLFNPYKHILCNWKTFSDLHEIFLKKIPSTRHCPGSPNMERQLWPTSCHVEILNESTEEHSHEALPGLTGSTFR